MLPPHTHWRITRSFSCNIMSYALMADWSATLADLASCTHGGTASAGSPHPAEAGGHALWSCTLSLYIWSTRDDSRTYLRGCRSREGCRSRRRDWGLSLLLRPWVRVLGALRHCYALGGSAGHESTKYSPDVLWSKAARHATSMRNQAGPAKASFSAALFLSQRVRCVEGHKDMTSVRAMLALEQPVASCSYAVYSSSRRATRRALPRRYTGRTHAVAVSCGCLAACKKLPWPSGLFTHRRLL